MVIWITELSGSARRHWSLISLDAQCSVPGARTLPDQVRCNFMDTGKAKKA